MGPAEAATNDAIRLILAYLKAAFPDHTVEVHEDHGVRGHRFVLSDSSGASLAPLLVPTAALRDIRVRADGGFPAQRLQRLLLHRDVIGKLRAAGPNDRVIFARSGIGVQRGREPHQE